MLRVRTPTVVSQKPMTISPYLLHPIGGSEHDAARQHYSTESGYATIHDLTSSQSNSDDLFTRTWEPIDSETPTQILALPTKKTTTTTITITGQQHHGSHHHHHEHTPQVQKMEHDMKHKLFYINATNFDGNPLATNTKYRNHTKIGLVNLDLNPPPTPPPYTTDSRRMPTIYYAATPPSFPPPRTTSPMVLSHHTPAPGIFNYPHELHTVMSGGHIPHKTHEGYSTAPGFNANEVQRSQYPIQTIQSPPYLQYPPSQKQPYNTMVSFPAHVPVQTTTTQFQNPFQQYNQMPAPPPYNVPNIPQVNSGVGGSIIATSAPIFASSSTQSLHPLPDMTTGVGYVIGGMTSVISSGSTLSNQDKSKPKGELHNFSFYR